MNGQRPNPLLNEDHGLRARDVETAATTFAREHIVDAHHVVAGLLKSRAILFIRAPGRLLLLRPCQPAHFVFRTLTAVRATERRLFQFLLFVKKILFVHFVYRKLVA